MNDFESRLHDTLDAQAHQAPDASGMAGEARRRMRRRRVTRTVVAAAVVAVALPIGFSQLGGLGLGGSDHSDRSDQGKNVATNGATRDPTSWRTVVPTLAADGFRFETWHGVSVQVPVDWATGASSAWCAGGESPGDVVPVVTRPDTMAIRIACDPADGYGVTLGSSASNSLDYVSGEVWQYGSEGVDRPLYPEGAWLGYWADSDDGADGAVTVVTPDRELTQRIIDSATKVTTFDPNGCPAFKNDSDPIMGDSEGVALCRWDDLGGLVASRWLTGEQATAAVEALTSAPVRAKSYRCVPSDRNGPTRPQDTWVYQDGKVVAVAVFGECGGVYDRSNGLQMTDALRALVDIPN